MQGRGITQPRARIFYHFYNSYSGPLKEVEVLSRIPLCGHEESSNIDVCAWSPTESVLVTAGFDRKVFLWNLGGGDDDKGRYGL